MLGQVDSRFHIYALTQRVVSDAQNVSPQARVARTAEQIIWIIDRGFFCQQFVSAGVSDPGYSLIELSVLIASAMMVL